ncbi:MAG: hypothetical protein IT457_17315 [Planctomycetes bacterium]|nr:hypothetical protein [Planctomycetota bacterium]
MSADHDDDREGAEDRAEAWIFDRQGPPDPTVVALESLLARYAYDGRRAPRAPRRRGLVLAALAAAALVAILARWFAGPGEPVAPRGDGFLVALADEPDRALGAGAWCEVAPRARRLLIGGLGWVEIAAGSRLRVDETRRERTSLFLEQGRIEASIDPRAGARVFQVATPAVLCIDLGCHYVLEHDAATGEASVRVTLGRVAFANGDREVIVPHGAACRARADRLGTPCFDDAAEGLRKLLARFDGLPALEPERAELARAIAAEVERPLDTLVLWHLLGDPDPEVAAAAERALVRVAGLPPEAQARKQTEGLDAESWRAHVEGLWWR